MQKTIIPTYCALFTFLVLSAFLNAQCPPPSADIVISGASATDYTLVAGDTMHITATGNYSGAVTIEGGVLYNCASAAQNMTLTTNTTGPTGTVYNYGTINFIGANDHLDTEIYNYGTFNKTGDLVMDTDGKWYNYGTTVATGKLTAKVTGAFYNYGTLSGGGDLKVELGGEIYNYTGATMSGGKFILDGYYSNAGTANVGTNYDQGNTGVVDIEGGCFNVTSNFSNHGTINGNICGTIDLPAGGGNNTGSILGTLAIVNPSEPSHPYLNSNSGTVAGTVIGTSCGCPGAGDPDLDIQLEIVDLQTPVDSAAVYSITVTNKGTADATSVQITSLIPTGLTFVDYKGDGTYNSGTGIWDIALISINEAVILNIIAEVNSSGSYQIDAEITACSGTDPDSDPSSSFGVDDLSDSIADDDEVSTTIVPLAIDNCNDRRQYAALNITAAAVSPYPTTTWPGGFSQTFPTGTEDFTFTFDNSYITGDSIISPDWKGNGTLTYTMNDANASSDASHSGDDRVTEYHDWSPAVKPNETENVYRIFGRGIFSFNSASAPLAHDYDLLFDFNSLDEGYLPAGTILGFTDIDGTGNGETLTLTATPNVGPDTLWLSFFDQTVDPVDPAGLVTYDPVLHSYVLDGPSTSNESVAYVTTIDLASININVYNDGSSIGLKLAAPMIKAPAITIDDVSVNESTGNAVFTVSIDCTNTFDVNFDYTTSGGSAIEGTDYTATSGTGTISAGSTSTTISVPITNDALDENDETYVIDLSNPVNAIITDAQGSGSIQDDDPLPSLSVTTGTFSETVGFASFDVNLSAVSGRDVTFWYSSTAYTAEDPADFISTVGSHLMPAGNTTWTFWVPIIDDAVSEGTEGIFTNIYSPTNASIAVAQDTMWIIDDEAVPCLPHPLLHLKADVGFSPPTWSDQSPHGNDATLFGDPSMVADAMNFNRGVNFDGNDHAEVSLPELVFDSGDKHIMIFAVYEPSTSSSAIGVFGNQGTNTGTIELYNNLFGVGYGSLIMSSAFGNTPHLITYVIDEEDNVSGTANSSKFYHNGDLKTSVTFNEGNSANMDTNFHIGKSGSFGSSQFFQGNIHEMLIYHENNGSVSLTEDQRIQIESYLALKYGISLNHNYTDSQ